MANKPRREICPSCILPKKIGCEMAGGLLLCCAHRNREGAIRCMERTINILMAEPVVVGRLAVMKIAAERALNGDPEPQK